MSKEEDKATIKKAMTSIKRSMKDNKKPSPDDINTIRQIAAKYPNDPEFTALLEVAVRMFIEAQEAAAKELSSIKSLTYPYTTEQYQALLKKENEYFDDDKTKARHELIHKMMSGARIDDNDPSGKSITTKQFTNFIDDISSEETKTKRQEASELLAHDAKRLKEKRESGNPLTQLEEERGKQVENRVDKGFQEELYEAKFNHHKALHAEELGKRIEDITTEEVVKARGNHIIEDVVNIFPRIKEAFLGIEERLAALIFHNPKAIHEHHNNIDQLKIEAEAAYKQQHKYEKAKAVENQTKEERKEIAIVTETKELKVEDSIDRSSEKKAVTEEKATEEKNTASSDKFAAIKAKREAAKAEARKAVEAIKSGIVIKDMAGPLTSPDHTPSTTMNDSNKENSHDNH